MTEKSLVIALVQENPTMGDLPLNREKVLSCYKKAVEEGADLVLFPELFLTGYPPEDLLYLPEFLDRVEEEVERIRKEVREVPLLMGAPFREEDLHNSAILFQNGEIQGVAHKSYLPNYGVFDEERYFTPGDYFLLFTYRGLRIGVTICEDLWFPGLPLEVFSGPGRADLILNISASPYHRGKQELRRRMFRTRAEDYHLAIAYVNLVGGHDELVFDGGSMGIQADGEVIIEAPLFQEGIYYFPFTSTRIYRSRLRDPRQRYLHPSSHFSLREVSLSSPEKRSSFVPPPLLSSSLSQEEEIVGALTLGLKDYVEKNGFPGVLVGISGGIDSALVVSLAVRALGKERVLGISMPGPFTSKESLRDATELANGLGIPFQIVSIVPLYEKFLEILKDLLPSQKGVVFENLQARLRGIVLMAFSNSLGYLVLATGNKSELSLGYATLYGDMVGGFAVIKDLTKRWVYQVARYLKEKEGYPIPEGIFHRPPTAELRENQTDEGDLYPYRVIDTVVEGYVEKSLTLQELLKEGLQKEVVKKILERIDQNEYKRRQAPIGIRITPRALGKDWRMPIVNRFRRS